jgi:hypothetical protein
MKFENAIEVSGIENVVFNRKVKWINNGTSWKTESEDGEMSNSEMMDIIHSMNISHRYRMWVHTDTLNIVVREKNK